LEILREMSSKRGKFLKRTMRVNWSLKTDGGLKPKKRFVGGVWIFSGKTELTSLIDISKFYQRKQGYNLSFFLANDVTLVTSYGCCQRLKINEYEIRLSSGL